MNYKWCMVHIDEGFCTMYFSETREELEEKMLAMVKESMIDEAYCTKEGWLNLEERVRDNDEVSDDDYCLDMSACWIFRNFIGWDERWYIKEIR